MARLSLFVLVRKPRRSLAFLLAVILATGLVFALFVDRPARNFNFVAEFESLGKPRPGMFSPYFRFDISDAEPATELERNTKNIIIKTTKIDFMEPSRDSGSEWGFITLALPLNATEPDDFSMWKFERVTPPDDSDVFNSIRASENGSTQLSVETKPGSILRTGYRGVHDWFADSSYVFTVTDRASDDDSVPSVVIRLMSSDPMNGLIKLSRYIWHYKSQSATSLNEYSGSYPAKDQDPHQFRIGRDTKPDAANTNATFVIFVGEAGNDKTSVGALLPLTYFYAERSQGTLAVGSTRRKLEGADQLKIRLKSGQARISSDERSIQVNGRSSDVEINDEQLVQHRFDKLAGSVQGALVALIASLIGFTARPTIGGIFGLSKGTVSKTSPEDESSDEETSPEETPPPQEGSSEAELIDLA